VREAVERARARDAALFRVRLCAQGLRAQAELATLARVAGDTGPLREARAVAARIGARPLLRDLELLADRARLELAHG
jgi:hypothetical protein